MRDAMKTNEEIQHEAQRMIDLGRQYREQHRSGGGEVESHLCLLSNCPRGPSCHESLGERREHDIRMHICKCSVKLSF